MFFLKKREEKWKKTNVLVALKARNIYAVNVKSKNIAEMSVKKKIGANILKIAILLLILLKEEETKERKKT